MVLLMDFVRLRGWRVGQLAKAANMSVTTLSGHLRRTRKMSLQNCARVAEILGVPVGQVADGVILGADEKKVPCGIAGEALR